MTGVEGVAAAAAIVKGAQDLSSAATGGPASQDVVKELAKGTKGAEVAANAYADRLAVRHLLISRLWQPLFRFAAYRSEYFEHDFANDMAAKLADVPEENVVTPAPLVAVQAMEGLSYSLDEPNLKDMYLNLLRAASDREAAAGAHPAFAGIIKSLSAEETLILTQIMGETNDTPMVEIRLEGTPPTGYYVLRRHVVDINDDASGSPIEVPALAAFVDNWARLGLVTADYSTHHLREGAYDWVESRPEYKVHSRPTTDGLFRLTYQKGLLSVTAFGRLFWEVVSPHEGP